MTRRCIGCDVAPRKGGDTFDGGQFKQLTPSELAEEFTRFAAMPDVLISWDSPLTGPADPDAGHSIGGQELTQRPIETFFRTDDWGFKVPKGISVLPYCGCPHWTISQRILGLPRIGPFSTAVDDLPFQLVFERKEVIEGGVNKAAVVEVHPAVAIWLWCRDVEVDPDIWKYKRNPGKVLELWRLICERVEQTNGLPIPETDDQLDAVVSWLLAAKWISGNEVVLLGNRKTGSFLVPHSKTLVDAFDRFLRANPHLDQE